MAWLWQQFSVAQGVVHPDVVHSLVWQRPRARPPAVSGIPTASERGAKSEVAHVWAMWLPHPCRLRDPHRCRAGGGGGIRSGPQVGKVATSPLPSRGSPPLQSGGQNQEWPTCGQCGYVTPAVSGIPTAAERGGGGNQKRPTSGQSGYITPAVSGIPTALQSGGENQKWPICGQSGYVTPAVSGIPTAAERGAKSEVAHKWTMWLPHHCRLRYPQRFRAGGGGGGGGDQKWPTCGQCGYLTPAVSGIPTASERGANMKT